jgi:peroxisomal membrane protein 4
MNVSQEIIAIVTSIYSGAQYGLKVRFPHAFLMTFLFRNDLCLKKKIQSILTLTWHHAYSLAKFAGFYKVRFSMKRVPYEYFTDFFLG